MRQPWDKTSFPTLAIPLEYLAIIAPRREHRIALAIVAAIGMIIAMIVVLSEPSAYLHYGRYLCGRSNPFAIGPYPNSFDCLVDPPAARFIAAILWGLFSGALAAGAVSAIGLITRR